MLHPMYMHEALEIAAIDDRRQCISPHARALRALVNERKNLLQQIAALSEQLKLGEHGGIWSCEYRIGGVLYSATLLCGTEEAHGHAERLGLEPPQAVVAVVPEENAERIAAEIKAGKAAMQ